MVLRCVLLGLITVLTFLGQSSLASGQDSASSPLNAKGIQPDRTYVGWLPFERIDVYSGSLVLTFTDIDLPGGVPLRWQRTFNTKSATGGGMVWSYGLAGLPMAVVNGDPVTVWADNQWRTYEPTIRTADAAEHQTFYVTSGDTQKAMSKNYWVYDRGTAKQPRHQVLLPNGTVCDFDELHTIGEGTSVPTNVRYLTRASDPFGNSIEIRYFIDIQYDDDGRELHRSCHPSVIVQTILSGEGGNLRAQQRRVELGWDGDRLQSVTYKIPGGVDRVWTYSTVVRNGTIEHVATPPAGGSWTVATSESLVGVTTPQGGTVTYTISSHTFRRDTAGAEWVTSRVVSNRTANPGAAAASWDFVYDYVDTETGGEERTSVVGPSGKKEFVFPGEPLPRAVRLYGRQATAPFTIESQPSETEEFTWGYHGSVGTPPISIGPPGGDPNIRLLERYATVRGGRKVETTYTYDDGQIVTPR